MQPSKLQVYVFLALWLSSWRLLCSARVKICISLVNATAELLGEGGIYLWAARKFASMDSLALLRFADFEIACRRSRGRRNVSLWARSGHLWSRMASDHGRMGILGFQVWSHCRDERDWKLRHSATDRHFCLRNTAISWKLKSAIDRRGWVEWKKRCAGGGVPRGAFEALLRVDRCSEVGCGMNRRFFNGCWVKENSGVQMLRRGIETL